MRTIERVQRALNPRLELQGVVLTMYDQRNNLCDLVAADVRGHFGDKVYDTVIPRNVRVSEAPSHGKPVLIYDHRCAGAQAYIQLAGEMLRRAEAGRTSAMSERAQAAPARPRPRGVVRRGRDRRRGRPGGRSAGCAIELIRPERIPAAPPLCRSRARRARPVDPREGRAAAAAGAPGRRR